MNAAQPIQGRRVAVLGAGPAGLMAAWELAEAGYQVTVLEADHKVGGLAATLSFQGQAGEYRFDFGGHRFITKNPQLLAFIEELMGEDLLHSIRSSVIRYRGATYQYPLALGDILRNAPRRMLLGVAADLLLRLPFAKPPQDREEASFAEWICSRFGPTLYQHFFAGYTGKLWGIDPSELSADWAAQRISLLDLRDVARRLLPGRSDTPRTYARNYRYPKTGFGAIFERLAQRLQARGVELLLNSPVTGLGLQGERVTAVDFTNADQPCSIAVDAVISTLPMPLMMRMLGQQTRLGYRALRFFNLPMNRQDISPHTWQYLSDPGILATRLQEPRRRSPFMAPPGKTSIMLEIPCQQGDAVWSMADAQLFERVRSDLLQLGIDPNWATGEYFSAFAAHAYPLMYRGYQRERERNIEVLNRVGNLILCGRQGAFRYIFTDTAMEMGQLAAHSLIEGRDERRRIYDFRNEKLVLETQSVA